MTKRKKPALIRNVIKKVESVEKVDVETNEVYKEPKIDFSGKWLNTAGFREGMIVNIMYGDNYAIVSLKRDPLER